MSKKTLNKSPHSNPKLGVSPEGTLMDFKADLDSEFGFAYERFLDFEKAAHSHNRFVICTPRLGSEFEVKDETTGKKAVGTKRTFIFKPPRTNHSLRSLKTVYDNIVFLPSEELMRSIFSTLDYKKEAWDELVSVGVRSMPRSEWLDSLAERYLSRRLFSPERTLKFLEEEIIVEVLELILGKPSLRQSTETRSSPGIARALELIESSLFTDLSIEDVAKGSGLSRASLLRSFKTDLETSPMAYVRSRRLEAARSLLQKKNHSVTEVSLLVGYEDISAFSRAYKAKFAESPQSTM